jgi:hypothetical protein
MRRGAMGQQALPNRRTGSIRDMLKLRYSPLSEQRSVHEPGHKKERKTTFWEKGVDGIFIGNSPNVRATEREKDPYR